MPPASPKGIAAALFKVQQEVPELQKDKVNPHFGNRYIGLDTLMEAVLPVLRANGILLVQTMDNVNGEPALKTQLIDVATSETIEGTCTLKLDRQSAQGVGSAVTYYRRYALMAALGLVADEDDDGNAAAPFQAAAPTAPAAAPAPAGDSPFGGGL